MLNKKEVALFSLSIILSSFVLSFRYYGTRFFNLEKAVLDLIKYLILFTAIYLLFIYSQKLMAKQLGYESEFKLWSYGPLLSLLITFVSFGLIPYLYFGSLEITASAKSRLGHNRKSVSVKDLAWIAITGPVVISIIGMIFLEPLYYFTGLPEIIDAMIIIALIIIFTTIPTPYSNGAHLLLKNRSWWTLLVLYAITGLVLFYFFNFLSFLLAFFISLVLLGLILYYIAPKIR